MAPRYNNGQFMKPDFMKENMPDAANLLHLRRISEESELWKAMFESTNRDLEVKDHFMPGGSIVDATIISAPPSVKNADKKRDEEMSSTRKGKIYRGGLSVSGFLIREKDRMKSRVRVILPIYYIILTSLFS